MNTWLATLVVIFSSLIVTSASACEFEDVMLGECPAEQSFAMPEGTSNRAAFSNDFIWTRYSGISGGRQGSIVLQGCFFKQQALSATSRSLIPIRTLSSSAWETATSTTIGAARHWTAQEMTLNGRLFRSRLSINFRAQDGSPRVCQSNDGSHIRVLFNSQEIYRSSIGWRNVSGDGWTMTLGASRWGVIAWPQALHEFGHAFAFIHEMGHPGWAECIKFVDYGAIWWAGMFGIDAAGQPTNSMEEELAILRVNIEKAAEGYGLIGSTKTFDPRSIMTYEVSARAFSAHTECALPSNSELSPRDVATFLSIYGVIAT